MFGNNTVIIEGKLPPQWVAEQLEGILSRDENVENYETFLRRRWGMKQAPSVKGGSVADGDMY